MNRDDYLKFGLCFFAMVFVYFFMYQNVHVSSNSGCYDFIWT